jgi:perosamine synthetase
MEKSSPIKLIKPNISPAEIEAVSQVLKSGMLVNGPFVRRFEMLLADYLGIAQAVCVSSGTAALHLSLIAADIKPGDEVVVPAFTFPATANVVEILGAVPVFVDCRPGSVNFDESKLVNSISVRTKAIMPVHAFGVPVEMEPVLEIASKYKLAVVEDAACALGSKYRDNYCGTMGDLAAFSFHPRKLLTTGEGGAVVTNDRVTANIIRSLRNHGGDNGDFIYPGLNYRMTDFQAAIGAVQMERYQSFLEKRRQLADLYRSLLNETDWLEPLTTEAWNEWNIQTFLVKVPDRFDRNSLIAFLNSHDIEAAIGTYCVPLTKYYRLRYGFTPDEFPEAFHIYNHSLSLPLYNDMTESEMSRVVDALKLFAKKNETVTV